MKKRSLKTKLLALSVVLILAALSVYAGSHISLLLFGMLHVFGLSRGFANATPTSLATGFHSR